ncbi:hypothetical protein ETAA8_68140 [Anatilimnocola aggregata]|uniref:DUF7716 domain-containing protein n=1 Tax=Anatilimnocola aggregata TaxID=2528021 RepID=A0A517YN64_9BACT|nr:hypothetical protein ETAA8_68140 [Anatilimnocola aggregata]
MDRLITLSQFLQSPDDFPWNEAIYLPANKPWSLNSTLAVWSADDYEEGEEPDIARTNCLRYALGVSSGQDIVANAKQQKPVLTLDELLDAFMFFYKHDAFISIK